MTPDPKPTEALKPKFQKGGDEPCRTIHCAATPVIDTDGPAEGRPVPNVRSDAPVDVQSVDEGQDPWTGNNPAMELVETLMEIEVHCPCGARPESPNTHPHVTGCPVEKSIRIAEQLMHTRATDRDAELAAMRALLSLIHQSFCENDEEMHNMPPGSYSGKLHERSQETIGISAHLQAMQSNQEQRGAAESCTPSSNAGSLVDLSKQASGQGVGAEQEVLPYNQEQEAKRPIQGGGAQGDQESGERWNPEKTNLLSGLRKKEDFARASRRLQQSIEGDLGVFDLSWPETQKAVVCIFSAVASALKGAE